MTNYARGDKNSTDKERLLHVSQQSKKTVKDIELELQVLAKKLGKSPYECACKFANQIISISEQEQGNTLKEISPSIILGGAFLSISAANTAIEHSDFDLFIVMITSISQSLTMANMLEDEKNAISKKMSEYAKMRLLNDPKQAEKLFVKESWDAWKSNPQQYTYNTTFATAMLDKLRPDDPEEEGKHLSSVKKITEWCTQWEREKIAPS